ncbi:MAG: hypothetical protein JXQ97_16555 [Natronospirillum sp.]
MISVISRVFLAVPIIIAVSFQESNASDFDISAFGTLSELSVRAENERILSSNVLFIGAGITTIAAIGLHIEGEYKTASVLSVTSAVALGGGVLARHYETSTERALARVLMIEDPSEREQRSRDALFQLASENRRSRLTAGVFNLGVASYYLLLDDSDEDTAVFNGVVSLATSVASFVIQSPAERAVKQLQNRNNQHAWLNDLDWQVAFNGGVNQQLAFGVRF